MKPKAIIKIIIDIVLTVGLMALMGYQFWGEIAHEWIGAGMFVLFIAHHILNFGWYRSLFKGKYSPARIFRLVINVTVLATMLGLMISGIIMSSYVFAFLNISGGMMFARSLHIISSYWGFVLMALHLGLHWNMVISAARKIFKPKSKSKPRTIILFSISALIAGYGIYVFVIREFMTYMLLRSPFVFLDYDEPKLLFYLDYIALLGLFIFVSHYISKLLSLIKTGKKKAERDDNL